MILVLSQLFLQNPIVGTEEEPARSGILRICKIIGNEMLCANTSSQDAIFRAVQSKHVLDSGTVLNRKYSDFWLKKKERRPKKHQLIFCSGGLSYVFEPLRLVCLLVQATNKLSLLLY